MKRTVSSIGVSGSNLWYWGLLRMPNIRVGKITPVALQNVDIIDTQPFQTVLHRREDMLKQVQSGCMNLQVKSEFTLRESP